MFFIVASPSDFEEVQRQRQRQRRLFLCPVQQETLLPVPQYLRANLLLPAAAQLCLFLLQQRMIVSASRSTEFSRLSWLHFVNFDNLIAFAAGWVGCNIINKYQAFISIYTYKYHWTYFRPSLWSPSLRRSSLRRRPSLWPPSLRRPSSRRPSLRRPSSTFYFLFEVLWRIIIYRRNHSKFSRFADKNWR